jgi:hypothetical protein
MLTAVSPFAHVHAVATPTILSVVGFNPFARHRRSGADYLMVVAAFVVIAVLLAWALFG